MQPETSLIPDSTRPYLHKVTVAWLFGSVWYSVVILGVPLTLYAKTLGATEWHIGLLSALPYLVLLLSIPAGMWIDATGDRKRIFMIFLLVQRLMWIPIIIVPSYLVWNSPDENTRELALWIFLSMMLVMHAGQAVGGPAWLNWMADLVPRRIRGRYFARRRQLGIIPALPALILAGLAIDYFAPHGASQHATLLTLGVIFALAMVCGIADILMFANIPHDRPPKSQNRNPLGLLLEPLRDRTYMGFCLAVGVTVFTGVPLAQFLILYLTEHLNIHSGEAQLMLLVLPLVLQMIFWPVWGQMVDLMGMRPTLLIASLGQLPLIVGWIFVGHGPYWIGYFLAGGMMVLGAGVDAVNLQIVLRATGKRVDNRAGELAKRGSTQFAAMNALVLGFAGFFGGILGGWLMYALKGSPGANRPYFLSWASNYDVLFVVLAALRLVVMLMLLRLMVEPGAKSVGHASRFLTLRMLSTLSHPLRLIRSRLEPRASEI